MKNLSIRLLLPVAAFVLASAGAVSTSSSSKVSAASPVQGWNRIETSDCQPVKMCNNISEALCVDGSGNQVYEKPSEFSDCTQLLTHQP